MRFQELKFAARLYAKSSYSGGYYDRIALGEFNRIESFCRQRSLAVNRDKNLCGTLAREFGEHLFAAQLKLLHCEIF